MLRTHRDLAVWQKSFQLCKRIYAGTKNFPSDERFGLTAQLRRSVVSIPSNIAEGYNRATTRDYVRFLWIANGSLAEAETQIMLAEQLHYLESPAAKELVDSIAEIERMLRALIRALEKKAATQ